VVFVIVLNVLKDNTGFQTPLIAIEEGKQLTEPMQHQMRALKCPSTPPAPAREYRLRKRDLVE
jgi:hypothetical protein